MNPPPKINILMVDDEPANLIALEAMLEDLGQNLVKASSGKDALRRVLEQDFALILLDVQMPEINGIETAVAIREREKSRHIPVIFLTAHMNTDEIVFKGYSAGAVDFLTKPLRAEVLRAKVSVFIELALIRERLQGEVAERTRSANEISQLNDQLALKNRELADTVEELERYSYSISHDMRAPLRAMQGFSEILLEECADQLSPDHCRYLKKIESGATRLDQLIRDVLSYSLIARSRFNLQAVDLDRLAHDIIDQYPGFQLPDADIQIEGHLPNVMANEAALTQCVSNLIANAIKFVKPGIIPSILIRTEPRVGESRIWFIDNGIGIAPENLERIFGIFVKIHAPETYAGTGIGLSIVRKAAQKMGAQVGVESTVGIGSRFWIQIKNAS